MNRAGSAEAAHFLRFDEVVQGLGKQHVSVAFALESLPDGKTFDAKRPLAKQFRIIPAAPGQVSVYFPAQAEVSGLRFHLHGPLVPELSRASVKKTPVNDPLFQQLARLSASSLHTIRDLRLLTGDFLAVLPNPQDELPDRYVPIRQAIVEEMNNQPLTPVHGGKRHAPARHLLQARASLKALLLDADIEYLVDYEDVPPRWAIAATQRNSEQDRFLDGLAISTWDLEQFVALLLDRAADGQRYLPLPPYLVTGPDPTFMEWLASKPVEWHQQLYALLDEHLTGAGWRRDSVAQQLQILRIVRLGTGGYSTGGKCYFATEATEHDEVLPRVCRAVYSSGKSKGQKEAARRFLEAVGVREVGETEQIEAILETRYAQESEIPDDTTYWSDLKRFVDLVERQPETATLFADAYIFERASDDWATPGDVYLDNPYVETGLKAYYQAMGGEAKRAGLADRYQSCGIPVQKLAHFAEAVGAQVRLEITEKDVSRNPQATYLYSAGGERHTSPINRDFVIERLEELLEKPSLSVARLVWRTMCSLPPYPDVLTATFRRSERGGERHADSQLVHMLRAATWVPQEDGFVRPAEGVRELLPAGFPFDSGQKWLKAVRFGEEAGDTVEARHRKQELAREAGFNDESELAEARWFVGLNPEERQRVRREIEARHAVELPDHTLRSPEARAGKVAARAAEAPHREVEIRERSVAVGLGRVKDEAEQYLRQEYTNADGLMVCQICRTEMPFRMKSGLHYFEKVEILEDIEGRHRENYLALCPNDAARFQYANDSEDILRQTLVDAEGQEVEVVLAGRNHTIYFTQAHVADLKVVIGSVEHAIAEAGRDAEG